MSISYHPASRENEKKPCILAPVCIRLLCPRKRSPTERRPRPSNLEAAWLPLRCDRDKFPHGAAHQLCRKSERTSCRRHLARQLRAPPDIQAAPKRQSNASHRCDLSAIPIDGRTARRVPRLRNASRKCVESRSCRTSEPVCRAHDERKGATRPAWIPKTRTAWLVAEDTVRHSPCRWPQYDPCQPRRGQRGAIGPSRCARTIPLRVRSDFQECPSMFGFRVDRCSFHRLSTNRPACRQGYSPRLDRFQTSAVSILQRWFSDSNRDSTPGDQTRTDWPSPAGVRANSRPCRHLQRRRIPPPADETFCRKQGL